MNALVIGAGKGIGFSTVEAFLEEKVRVIAFSRNTEKLKELQNKWNEKLLVIEGDITSEIDLEKLVNEINNSGWKINYMVNCAGILIKKKFSDFTGEEFREIYNTNVFGIYRSIVATLPFFDHTKLANIITIGSMGGVTGALKFPGMLFYSSSKAALACLTECLAEELKDQNIHLNCLALGAVETEMKKAAFPDFQAPHESHQIASFIVNFAINSAAFFNGKTLPVSISTP